MKHQSFSLSKQETTSCPVSQKKKIAKIISATVTRSGLEGERNGHDGSESIIRKKQRVCDILSKARSISRPNPIIAHVEKPKPMQVFCCDTCQKGFKWKQNLTRHLIIHRTNCLLEESFSCEECENLFSRKPDLERHILSVHYNQKRHICNHCKKAFRDKAGLKNHTGVVHLKDSKFTKRFGCENCGRAFSQRSNLILHLQSHETKVQLRRPFKCAECKKRFLNKSLLKEHILVLHLNQRQYTCHYCQKAFGYKSSLTKHIKSIHLNDTNYMKRFVCLNCKKRFCSQYSLTQHLQAHQRGLLERKLFSCSRCQASFTQKSNLKRHVKVNHDNVGPYSCDGCRKAFSEKSHLIRHIQKYEKMNL